MNAEDLNHFDLLEAKKILGQPLSQETDEIALAYVVTYLLAKKEDAGITWNDWQNKTIGEIQVLAGVEEEETVVLPFDDTPKA